MKLAFTLAPIFLSTFALADAGHGTVSLKIESGKTINAGKSEVSFKIFDSKRNKSVTDADLEVVHEKKVHMLVFDRSLTQFFHIHPEFKSNSWKVNAEIPTNGKYHIYLEGKQKTSGEFTAHDVIQVKGGSPELPAANNITPQKSGTSGESVVTLSGDTFSTTQDSHIRLTFSRTDGQRAKITNYLGAKAHVVVTPLDGSELLHVHPMEEGSDIALGLHTRFKKAGDYRMWIEFIDHGVKRTVPLWIRATGESSGAHH